MKYNNTKLKRSMSLMLSTLLILSSLSYLNRIYADDVTKYETAFVNLDSNGTQKETIISNWLKDSRFQKNVLDKASLNNINNVSSSLSPIIKKDSLEWKSNGEDIIYQGSTTKQLPITTKITYYLDDKEISAKELAGKSGKVKININFENNTFENKVINGRNKMLATPFTVASVIGLDSKKFSNIESENSKMFTDGNNEMIMFLGFPGLNKSMDLDNMSIEQVKSINIPEEFSVTADVKDFELSTIAVVATPQLPDMIKDIDSDKKEILEKKKDIDKGLGKIDDAIKDVDVAKKAKDTIKKIDPNDSIKSLITDNKKTTDAKNILDDLFKYYELDKSIMDILPNYVTQENVDLYDKIKNDTNDLDMDYILDNQTLRGITDRMNDEQINKSRVLLKDYDELQTIDMDKVDKALDIVKDYDKIKPIIDTSSKLYDTIKEHDKELDTLDKATKYTDRIFDIIDKIDETSFGAGNVTQDDIKWVIQKLIEKKSGEISSSYTANFPTDLSVALTPEQQQSVISIINTAVSSGQVPAEQATPIIGAIQATGIVAEPARPLVQSGIEQAKNTINQKVQETVSEQVSDIKTSLQSIMMDVNDIKYDVEQDMGYNYKSDLRSSLEFVDSIMPDVRYIRDQEKINRESVQKAINYLKNADEVKYIEHWGNRAKDMKKNMDDNKENIDVMRDMLSLYDDPKINKFYKKIPVLRADMDLVRPIMNNLSDDLDIEKYNISLHKSPQTVKTLLDMKNDLDANKYMSNILKLSLNDEVINSAREMIAIIDRRDAKDELDTAHQDLMDIKKQLNDANGYVNDALDMIDSKDALVNLSNSYNTFTGKQEDMKSKVTFVMKTDEIKVENKEEKFVAKQEEKKSFVGWIKGLFHKKA